MIDASTFSKLTSFCHFQNPHTTLRALYVGTTSKLSLAERHNLISTTLQRCSNVRCPLGKCVLKCQHCIQIAYKIANVFEIIVFQ